MRKRLFMIPSLIAAGFFPQKAGAVVPGTFVDKKDPKPTLFERFRLQHRYTLAGHRSHSSHASHSSHSSHRSSSGGYSYGRTYEPSPTYSSPSPTYEAPSYPSVPTAPSTSAPNPSNRLYDPPARNQPSTATPTVLPGNSNKFKRIVAQVQTALAAFGYYAGTIDGSVNPDTRVALSRYQSDNGLRSTGTVTLQTLDALRIVGE